MNTNNKLKGVFFLLAASSLLLGSCAPSPVTKEGAQTQQKSSLTAPPLGEWKNKQTGLIVYITPQPGSVDDGILVRGAYVNISGPPPRIGRADDFFMPTKHQLTGNKLTLTGNFSFGDNPNMKLEVTWTKSSVALKILDNKGHYVYKAKNYPLTKAN